MSLLRYTRTLLSRSREPKTALTGGILENPSARLKALMAAFNIEMVPSRSLGLWDSVSMIETQGKWERPMRCEGLGKVPSPNGDERQYCYAAAVTRPVKWWREHSRTGVSAVYPEPFMVTSRLLSDPTKIPCRNFSLVDRWRNAMPLPCLPFGLTLRISSGHILKTPNYHVSSTYLSSYSINPPRLIAPRFTVFTTGGYLIDFPSHPFIHSWITGLPASTHCQYFLPKCPEDALAADVFLTRSHCRIARRRRCIASSKRSTILFPLLRFQVFRVGFLRVPSQFNL